MTNPASHSPVRPRRMRWWIPSLLVAAAGGVALWLHLTDDFRRGIGVPVMGVFTAVLLALWWIFLTDLPKHRRLLCGAGLLGLILLAAFLGPRLLRWEGSRDGKATPRLVWRWTTAPDVILTNAPSLATATDAMALPGLKDFPRYLGPAGDGVMAEAALNPDWDSAPPRLLWRQSIGAGWSGFAVAGRRAVTQEQRGDDELVSCYDVATGALLWMHTNRVRFSERLGGDGPRATPTLDGGRVFVQGATGLLDCLDLETGRKLWGVDVLAVAGSPNLTWGKSNGPLIDGDRVVVSGGEGGPSLLAFAKDTGAPLWKAGTDSASFASPALMILAGRVQIVTVNARSVAGHDPETGRELWSHPWPGAQPKVGQPLLLGTNRVLVSAGYGVGSVLLEIAPTATDETWAATVVWKARSIRNKFSSLVVRDGFAYGLEEETLACIDLTDGRRVWKDGKYGFGQVLLAGGHLLIQSESGPVALVAAEPGGWRDLARLSALSGKTWNPPALAGNILLVRNDTEAAAYELPTTARE